MKLKSLSFCIFFSLLCLSAFSEENACIEAKFKLKEILKKISVTSDSIFPLTKKCNDEKILYNLSIAYMKEENFIQAIDTLKDLIEINGKEIYLNTLGKAYLSNKDYKEASIFYNKSLQKNSSSVDALIGLGIISAKDNNFKNAKTNFLKATKLDKKNFYAYYNLGLLAKSQKNYEDAFSYLNRAYDLNSSFTDVLYEIADIDLIQSNFQDSINKLKIIISKDPKNSNAMDLLSKSYFELYNFEKAVFWSKKALKIKPNDLRIRIQLANSLLKNKQAYRAKNILKVNNLDKECCEIDYLISLAKVETELGNFLSARNSLEQVKIMLKSEKLESDNPESFDEKIEEIDLLLSEIALIN